MRLLHVVSVFGDDPRVRISWTIAPGSRFADRTGDYLVRHGVRLTSWKRASAKRFDLVMATSANGELERLNGPLMLLPHGAGFSRVAGPGQSAPAGLAASQLVRSGRVIADVVGLEHENQRARLAAYCPPAAPRGVVLGDPVRDRMSAGLRLRGLYRAALGVTDRQALVVLSSTWGPGSLFDAHPDLPGQLTAALDVDGYRLAAIVHPNAAADMGAWEVGRLLSRARAAGLELIAPDRWEAAVLAADLVVGDHGSTSLYAAAAGIRVMLGAYDGAQIVPDSPMAALAAGLPRLGPDSALEPQIAAGLAQDTNASVYRHARDIAGLAGRSLEITQRTAYRLLRLSLPTRAPRVRAPEPCRPEARPRDAHLVLVDRCDDGQAELHVRRYAAGVDSDLVVESDEAEICRHLAASAFELDEALRANAEVLLLERADTGGGSLIQALRQLLGAGAVCARVAGTVIGPGRCLLVTEDDGAVELRMDVPDLDASILPSVLLALTEKQRTSISTGTSTGTSTGMSDAIGRLRDTGVVIRVGHATSRVNAYDPAPDRPSKPC